MTLQLKRSSKAAMVALIFSIVLITIPKTWADSTTSNFSDWCEIGIPYRACDNLTVTLNSLTFVEKTGSYQYTIAYTLKNENLNQKIDEGAFKMYYKDTSGGLPQYGFFGSLFPGDIVTRSYTFEELKSVLFDILAYNTIDTGFFSSEPPADSLKWNVLEYMPTDVVPPVTTHDYDCGWHVTDFIINLNATDSRSGIAATYYRINSGPTLMPGVSGQPLITTEGANNTLEYWSTDTAGNEELPHKMLSQIRLDKTAPAGSIQINNDATYCNSTTVNLKLFATDAVSSVSEMRFNNDYGGWSDWEFYSTSKSWNITAGEGVKNVFVQYKDLVSLTVTAYQNITLDMTPPFGNAGQNQTVTVNSATTLDGSNSTDNAGIATYLWDFGDGATGIGVTATHKYTNIGTYTVKLTVLDLAGNMATSSSTVYVEVVIPEFSSFALLASALSLTGLIVALRRLSHKL